MHCIRHLSPEINLEASRNLRGGVGAWAPLPTLKNCCCFHYFGRSSQKTQHTLSKLFITKIFFLSSNFHVSIYCDWMRLDTCFAKAVQAPYSKLFRDSECSFLRGRWQVLRNFIPYFNLISLFQSRAMSRHAFKVLCVISPFDTNIILHGGIFFFLNDQFVTRPIELEGVGVQDSLPNVYLINT